MTVMLNGQSLDADPCRDHRAPHRHRLVDLDTRSAADPQGNYVNLRIVHERPNVVDKSSELPVKLSSPSALDESPRRASADNDAPRPRSCAGDGRPYLIHEELDAVDVRHPVHRARKHHPSAIPILRRPTFPKAKVVQVPSRRNRDRKSTPLN